MNDNAKCAGVGCIIRDYCLRFTRPAVDGQQWVQPRLELRPSEDGYVERCIDFEQRPVTYAEVFGQPNPWLVLALPVEPHGGAPEEGDAC